MRKEPRYRRKLACTYFRNSACLVLNLYIHWGSRDETWVKHWFQKQSSKTSLPTTPFIPSTDRKPSGRSSSAPLSSSPRATARPGDLYVHEPPLGWAGPAASSPEDASGFDSDYDKQDRGQSSQSFHFNSFPILFETLHTDPSQPRPHAQDPDWRSKPIDVFSVPLQSQHHLNQAKESQNSPTMSPSLACVPSAFPISIFTDSPPKQLQNAAHIPANNYQSTNAQFPGPALQDPYSIRFPLTYSPRRRHAPCPTAPRHQQSQPQMAYNLNYDYDIPSESSFSVSLQSQSTSVRAQAPGHLDSINGTARYSAQKQLVFPMPIAYTTRLADLMALDLKTLKKPENSGAYGEDGQNSMQNPDLSSDNGLSKSGDTDENVVTETSSTANKSKLANSIHARSCTEINCNSE